MNKERLQVLPTIDECNRPYFVTIVIKIVNCLTILIKIVNLVNIVIKIVNQLEILDVTREEQKC